MNLQELAKKHNLKAGDKVLCTYSNLFFISPGEYLLHNDTDYGDLYIKNDTDYGDLYIKDDHGSSHSSAMAFDCRCRFELPEKKRHIHADLINWWAECPSENEIQVKLSEWVTLPSPEWNIRTEYRKKPTDTELKIEQLFDSSIDALHGIANEINELTG